MKHRIFIAINLPEDIRKKLSEFPAKWPELPVRWTKKENIHITLVFLGYLSEEELLFINWNKDFLKGETPTPIYMNIALAYKDQIIKDDATINKEKNKENDTIDLVDNKEEN